MPALTYDLFSYEETGRDYPLEKMEKISELLDVDIFDLLDDYNILLWMDCAFSAADLSN